MNNNPELTTIANRYQLLKRVGQGGMGDVYLALDLTLGRHVAVKTINQDLKNNAEVRKRIDRECKLHAALPVHSSIIALHDKIEEDGSVYLILEYFEGETLSSFLKSLKDSQTSLPPAATLDIIYQVLEALAHIHEHGILHRDIKPANIMVAPRQQGGYIAKLMDFGIAAQETADDALTQITALVAGGPGTPAYMAPERIDPETYGQPCPATDLYAAGVILYEILGGQPPFQGTLTEVFIAHLTKPINVNSLPESVSPGIKKVVAKSLSKKPQDRYAQARDLLADLHAAAAGKPTLAASAKPDDSTNTDPERTMLASYYGQQETMSDAVQAAIELVNARRRKKRLLLAACTVIAIMAGGLLAWQWYTAKPATSVPQQEVTKTGSEAKKPQQQNETSKNGTPANVTATGQVSSMQVSEGKGEVGEGMPIQQASMDQQQIPTESPKPVGIGARPGPQGLGSPRTEQQQQSLGMGSALENLNQIRQSQPDPVAAPKQPENKKIATSAPGEGKRGGSKTTPKAAAARTTDTGKSDYKTSRNDWIIENTPSRRKIN